MRASAGPLPRVPLHCLPGTPPCSLHRVPNPASLFRERLESVPKQAVVRRVASLPPDFPRVALHCVRGTLSCNLHFFPGTLQERLVFYYQTTFHLIAELLARRRGSSFCSRCTKGLDVWHPRDTKGETCISLTNNQRQDCTLHTQKVVLPYAFKDFHLGETARILS